MDNKLSKRIIPCLDIDKGRVVKGKSFVDLIDAGNPNELSKFYNMEGADELVFLDNNIDFNNVKRKLEIEALWNELILVKFSSKVKINEKELKKKIKDNNKFLKSYLLSEISFEVSNLKELNAKFQEISKVINDKGFDFAALKYSVSPTSNIGGKLDWINENSLNKNIREAIKKLEKNNFTKPINVPGGFLILQINDIKNTKIEIDIEKEFKRLENYEKNNQLNQYSKIYFNKVKKDLEISEL